MIITRKNGEVWRCERVDLDIENRLLLVKVRNGSITITRIPMDSVEHITKDESCSH